jgi:hypothetical protein
MSVTPAASQTRVPAGWPIIAEDSEGQRQVFQDRGAFDPSHRRSDANLDHAIGCGF